MIFSNVKFYTSSLVPLHEKNEVVFIGRSNVGKSSLINALCGQNGLAYVSKTPGHTKLLNYFLVANDFFLVDAPGYGYRKISYALDEFDKLMDGYFSSNPYLKLVVLLLDARRDLSSVDIDFLSYLEENNLPSIIVFTKADKLNQSSRQHALNNAYKHFPNERCIFTSSLNKKGIEELRSIIEEVTKHE